MQDLKKQNLKFLFIGYFFIIFSNTIISYYLPFYLKEQGLSALKIGAVLTGGLAIGGLLTGLIFSKLLYKIQLRTGLGVTAVLFSAANFTLFIIPTSIGVFITNSITSVKTTLHRISSDVTLQHNAEKKNHTTVSAIFLIVDSLGIIAGLILGWILTKWISWKYIFLIFAVIALISLLFYLRVTDNTRFTQKNIPKFPKLSTYIKLMMFTEVLYWLGLAASFSLVITFLVTDRYKGSMGWIAALFIALYVSITITTILSKKWIQKTNLLKTSIIGMSIILLSAILVIISTNMYVVFIAMVLEGIGAGIWVPSKTALFWGVTKPSAREHVSGYLNSARIFLQTLGPLIGAVLITYLGILAPFYFKIIISLTCIFIYGYLMTIERKQ